MSTGIYTGLGFSWARIGTRSGAFHLVPPRLGPLSTSACGRRVADTPLWTELGTIADADKCGRCLQKDGTAGPQRDGRIGYGE